MQAWGIHRYGSNEVLEQIEIKEPVLGDKDVLIAIKAASINPIDFKVRSGKLKLVRKYKFPLILGHDCSGVVTKVGKDVTQFKVGDEVFTRPANEQIGTLAEFIAVNQNAVALKPTNISYEQAASLPLIALTSWQALIDYGAIQSQQKVFIPAGSGGVGSFAIQLAKHFGAIVATTTSTKNVTWVKELGADKVIDYTQEDFTQELSDYDLVFDTMGAREQKKAFSILKPDGKLVSIVGPATVETAKDFNLGFVPKMILSLMSFSTLKQAKQYQANYSFIFMKSSGEQLNKIAALVEQEIIRPIVDKVLPFSQSNEAVAYVESGRAKGKVVVSMSS